MTVSNQQLRRLIEGLYLQTIKQAVKWSFNERDSICEAEIGAGYVQIAEEADDDGDYYSVARVLNKNRDVIDTIYGGTLGRDKTPVNTGHPDYWVLLRDLFSSAKRSALGADKVIDSIVDALGAKNMDVDDVPF